MKNKFFKILLCITIVIGMNACNKRFLEIVPEVFWMRPHLPLKKEYLNFYYPLMRCWMGMMAD